MGAREPGSFPLSPLSTAGAILTGEVRGHLLHPFADALGLIGEESLKLEEGPAVKPLVPVSPPSVTLGTDLSQVFDHKGGGRRIHDPFGCTVIAIPLKPLLGAPGRF